VAFHLAERSDLQITFFEYGSSAPTEQEAKSLNRVPRQIFSLAFAFDESKGRFREALAPAEVLHADAAQDARENKRNVVGIHFADSAPMEARLLQTVDRLAAKYDLKKKAPEPGYIGCIGAWSAVDLSLSVQRYDSLRDIEVSLDDYGRREVSWEIAEQLRVLPGVTGTRRYESVILRVGPKGVDPVVQAVGTIANKYGLRPASRKGMYNVAKFGAPDLHISIDLFESDGKIIVSIEDAGWHTQFAEIEQALRVGLSGVQPLE
jgi:hypothetical protein